MKRKLMEISEMDKKEVRFAILDVVIPPEK